MKYPANIKIFVLGCFLLCGAACERFDTGGIARFKARIEELEKQKAEIKKNEN